MLLEIIIIILKSNKVTKNDDVDKYEILMDDLASTSVLEVSFTKLRFCTQNFTLNFSTLKSIYKKKNLLK